MSSKTNRNVVGFNTNNVSKEEDKKERQKIEDNMELTHEAIATIGRMGPEFAGRFIVATLHRLNVDNLKRTMTESTISPLKEEVEVLKKDNIEFSADDKFITALANRAYNEGTGGRGIRNSIEKIFQNVYVRVVFEGDSTLEDQDGIIKLQGTTDEYDNIIIKNPTSESILYISCKEKQPKH